MDPNNKTSLKHLTTAQSQAKTSSTISLVQEVHSSSDDRDGIKHFYCKHVISCECCLLQGFVLADPPGKETPGRLLVKHNTGIWCNAARAEGPGSLLPLKEPISASFTSNQESDKRSVLGMNLSEGAR